MTDTPTHAPAYTVRCEECGNLVPRSVAPVTWIVCDTCAEEVE